LIGLGFGLAVYHVALKSSDLQLVSQESLDHQQQAMAELEAENQELTDDLFSAQEPLFTLLDSSQLPYDGNEDAAEEVLNARNTASEDGKFLMVTFGANWCLDCRTLHLILNSDEVQSYTEDTFQFINVDVGKFNQNRHVAEELGVNLARGIPVAIFFGPEGQVIGTTNDGQLEPARHYTSKQILKFVRDVAERSQISAPDSVL